MNTRQKIIQTLLLIGGALLFIPLNIMSNLISTPIVAIREVVGAIKRVWRKEPPKTDGSNDLMRFYVNEN